MKRPGAGPHSHITRQQVLDAAYRYIVLDQTQTDLARELGISPSYLARLIKKATDPDSGWIRIQVSTKDDPAIVDAQDMLDVANGQMAFVVDGKRICVVVDTARVPESSQKLTIGDVTVTVTISKKASLD